MAKNTLLVLIATALFVCSTCSEKKKGVIIDKDHIYFATTLFTMERKDHIYYWGVPGVDTLLNIGDSVEVTIKGYPLGLDYIIPLNYMHFKEISRIKKDSTVEVKEVKYKSIKSYKKL